MEAKSLRIGNYVYYNGTHEEIGIVSEILKNNINEVKPYKVGINHRLDIYYNIDNIKPIQLTEEWIFRLGLKECYRSDYTVKYELESNQSIEYIFREVNNQKFFRVYGFDFKCDFVHDLQNKIFSLTGEELTLKTE